MKNFFVILLFFTSIFTFSQVYHFDVFIKEKRERLERDRANWKYEGLFDSKNGFEVFFKTKNKKILAVFNDKDKNLRHIFRVTKAEDKYNFFYKHSSRISEPSSEYKNLNKENVIIAKKVDSVKYKIFIYDNLSLEKINEEILITLAKSDFNYLSINTEYNRSDDIEEELKKNLPTNSKFVIKTIEYFNAKGKVYYKTNYEIDVKIDFVLNVPGKLTFKQTDYWSDFED